MRRGKGTAIVVIALVLFAAVTAYTASAARQPSYTVFSADANGVSLLFDALKLMGYPIEVGFTAVGESSSVNDVVVIVEPSPFHFSEYNLDQLVDWVKRGGRLIYLSDGAGDIKRRFAHQPYYEDGLLALYEHGLGEALVGESSLVLNSALKDDVSAGFFIQNTIDGWGGDTVLFNEYVHGFKRGESFFRILPAGLKLLICQLGLVLLMVVWRAGKRFGRPVPYYEETERGENEAVKALAVIYKNAGKGEVAVESYYERLLLASAAFFGVSRDEADETLEELWRASGTKRLDDLILVRQYIRSGRGFNTKRPSGRRDMMKTVNKIKALTKQIKQ